MKNKEFSKILLKQESALIWVVTIGMMIIALICILRGYTGSLPWLAAMVGFPWTAYGVSQAFYYKKALKENTEGGIKFESVMAEVKATYGKVNTNLDWLNEFELETEDQIGEDYTPDLDYGI